ncbi:hypothetical protein [Lyngbya sp. PCC 8106]|uniref:hypothetical protein n=1 Tax=Lyngbya sp. (strain PCC 8106) TaxID=313612 RepID=UPI0000EA9B4B|nr:hypothetical protein [Lyngbya sp. PCC 8106]EAW35840.1 hypothetical protein L8106_02657 [Lyngbya sp. PCC 8106]
MSTQKTTGYDCQGYENHGCEFTVPITLNVPITINPVLFIKPVAPMKENLHAHLDANIHLSPEVAAAKPVCLPQNGYKRELSAAE